jgi:hypothetical protein
VTTLDRTRLAEAVAKLAVAIASGRCLPTLDELEALASICIAHDLPAEAARIRRWMVGTV